MNASDFDTWFQRHCDLFVGVYKMFHDRPESQRALSSSWLSILRDVDLEDAEKATDIMLSSPSRQPRQYNHWIGKVKEIAREIAKDRKQGDEKYLTTPHVEAKCQHCGDRGMVTVWKDTIEGAEDKDFYHARGCWGYYYVIIACFCETGSLRLNDERYGFLRDDVRFDPEGHEVHNIKGEKKRWEWAHPNQRPSWEPVSQVEEPKPIPGGVFNEDEVPF